MSKTYCVWYASAGCIPDSEYPEFVGTLAECESWITDNADDYVREWVEHDLYSLSIGEWEEDDDE